MSPDSPQRLGRYELLSVVGQGAMGVVYKAHDTFLDRIVAVKTYHPRMHSDEHAARRFLREVKTVSKLSHPNIVTIHDGGFEGDVPFLAMELVEGQSVEQLLAEKGRLSPSETLAILAPVADAVAYAHGQGVIHRDLKPSNILVSRDGEPKIVDFGVAKMVDMDASATTMRIVGTPSHMAPEQVTGAPVDGRADVFSLAVIAYEMLTGERPFGGDHLTAILYNVVHTDPLPPTRHVAGLGARVDAAIAHALAKDSAERTPDARTFAKELESALGGGPPQRRVPWIPISAAAVLVALVAAAAVLRSSIASLWSEPTPVTVARPVPTAPPVPAAPTAIPEPPVAAAPTAEPAVEVPTPVVAASVLETSPVGPAAVAPSPKPQVAPAPPRPRPTAPEIARRPPPPSLSSGNFAALKVTSSPPGAAVLIDSRLRGKTPIEIREVEPGRREIEVRRDGYPPYRETVTLAPGTTKSIDARLTSEPETGSLRVVSDPSGAEVRVNGVRKGLSPLALELAAGRYEITIEFPGMPPKSRVTDLRARERREMHFQIVP